MEAVMEFRAKLVPEFVITDLDVSLDFWCGHLGFQVVYDRPQQRFAYLDLDGAQIMLEQRNDNERQWITGPTEKPFGRGINFQIEVADVRVQLDSLRAVAWLLFMKLEEKWYRADSGEVGVHQFLVQDPDGYLIRLSSNMGKRMIQNIEAPK
jgi:catechol 2,3-dioxygenase-like lactoylglutathione lyase family enzyme